MAHINAQNLQWYLDNLDYADGRTWFDDSGNPLSDEAAAAMTAADKAQAFIEGRYAKGSLGGRGEMGGMRGGMPGNGSAQTPTGTDLSAWVDASDVSAVSFSLADAAAYRVRGTRKAIPGFDVIDYGQEDYVFGSAQRDARHWNRFLLDIFEAHADVLEPLFNNAN